MISTGNSGSQQKAIQGPGKERHCSMLRPQETQIPKVLLFTVQLVGCKALREAGERLASEIHLLLAHPAESRQGFTSWKQG